MAGTGGIAYVCVAPAHQFGESGNVTIHSGCWAYCGGGNEISGTHEWHQTNEPLTLTQLELERVVRRRYSSTRTERRGAGDRPTLRSRGGAQREAKK